MDISQSVYPFCHARWLVKRMVCVAQRSNSNWESVAPSSSSFTDLFCHVDNVRQFLILKMKSASKKRRFQLSTF